MYLMGVAALEGGGMPAGEGRGLACVRLINSLHSTLGRVTKWDHVIGCVCVCVCVLTVHGGEWYNDSVPVCCSAGAKVHCVPIH